jgi:hypothetical protein
MSHLGPNLNNYFASLLYQSGISKLMAFRQMCGLCGSFFMACRSATPPSFACFSPCAHRTKATRFPGSLGATQDFLYCVGGCMGRRFVFSLIILPGRPGKSKKNPGCDAGGGGGGGGGCSRSRKAPPTRRQRPFHYQAVCSPSCLALQCVSLV